VQGGLRTSLTFALHVLFEVVGERRFGPLRLYRPDPAGFDWRAGLLAGLACALAFGLKWPVLRILVACAAGGLALSLLT
jgi:chromate transporter